jgi:hypothetical protein
LSNTKFWPCLLIQRAAVKPEKPRHYAKDIIQTCIGENKDANPALDMRRKAKVKVDRIEM